MGAPDPDRTSARHRRPIPLGTRRLGVGQQLLLGGSAGGIGESGRHFSSARSTLPTPSPSTSRPQSLWIMALSVRIFGLSSWSILVPQALMGVGTVAAVWYGVRRWFSAGAALLASIAMALTPVAVLMFRFNNPDALLITAHDAGRRHDSARASKTAAGAG